MSVALHLASAEDIDRLVPLVTAFHTELGIDQDATTTRAALLPLLKGSPHGAVYVFGPVRAPIGYIALSFGWSIELGGLDGLVDELYVRPGVRGRGIATEVLLTLPRALAGSGLKALHLEVDRADRSAQRLYEKVGFELNDRYALMSRTFL